MRSSYTSHFKKLYSEVSWWLLSDSEPNWLPGLTYRCSCCFADWACGSICQHTMSSVNAGRKKGTEHQHGPYNESLCSRATYTDNDDVFAIMQDEKVRWNAPSQTGTSASCIQPIRSSKGKQDNENIVHR